MKHNKHYLNHLCLIGLPAVFGILAMLGVLTSCKMTERVPVSNISFDGKTFAKTSFTEIVAKGTKAEIFIDDDSSWSTYCNGGEDNYIPGLYLLKGVFLKGRKVRLSPFALSQYEVTQELYEAIMGHNPSNFKTGSEQKLRPVETVNWYAAIIFCNKLSLKLGLNPYYSIENKQINWEEIQYNEIPNEGTAKEERAEWDKVVCDKNSNGFRLPTEAEWELASRWQGENTANADHCGSVYLTRVNSASGAMLPVPDEKISLPQGKTYAELNTETQRVAVYNRWYDGSGWQEVEPAIDGALDVGIKQPNYLGLFDMSGNVYEFCFDIYDGDPKIDDAEYKEGEFIVDPQGNKHSKAKIPGRVRRGGSFSNKASYSIVGARNEQGPHLTSNRIGLRLALSL